MMSSRVFHRLIMIFAAGSAISCSNAIPTVDSLTSTTNPDVASPKNPYKFSQINAGSKKETVGGYKGTIRISQALGQMNANTADNRYKLKGTVTLQK